MPAPVENDQRRKDIIITAFGFIVSGIAWLSLNEEHLKPLGVIFGMLFMLFSGLHPYDWTERVRMAWWGDTVSC